MAKSKIVVNEMPKRSTDCPFSMQCSKEGFPGICDLKRDKAADIQFGISFGMGQRYNCQLDENKECDMLIAITDIQSRK